MVVSTTEGNWKDRLERKNKNFNKDQWEILSLVSLHAMKIPKKIVADSNPWIIHFWWNLAYFLTTKQLMANFSTSICVLEKSRQIFTNIIDRTLLTSVLQSNPWDDARCWVLAWAFPKRPGWSRHHQLRQGCEWQGPQLCQEESPCCKPHWKIRHLLHFTLQTKSLSKRKYKSK